MAVTTYTWLDGEIVGQNANGVKRDFVPDPLGSTIALLDENQTTTDTFAYWPYGEIRTGGSAQTRYQFLGSKGQRLVGGRDQATFRDLVLDLGRWLTVDPLWPSAAAYAYAMDSPTSLTDPEGLFPIGVVVLGLPGVGEAIVAAAGLCLVGYVCYEGACYLRDHPVTLPELNPPSVGTLPIAGPGPEPTPRPWRGPAPVWVNRLPNYKNCKALKDACYRAAGHKPRTWRRFQWENYCYSCFGKCLNGGIAKALRNGCDFWRVIWTGSPTA